ncbi:PorP/SprF family type IX secretion system membrane protein [Pontibacter sp. MBLB2868]|uniref:PorP/SprF family type IX secretion system membrane protein n=1 Tax=Pontibacter sp. MBLB2868 TaxID=3451555 RepID=UPI003F75289B
MKTNKWSIVLVVLGVAISNFATAQQAPQYTQYIFNELAINPAYAGSKGILNINATYRNQWSGLEGAPTTQFLSVDGPTGKSNMGWAGYIVHDEIGAQSQTGVYGSASVGIDLSTTTKLSFGLSLGAVQYTLDGTKLTSGSETPDSAIPQGRESKVLPDAKIGAFIHSERFFAGLTAASLVPFNSDNMFIATPRRHYFLSTGYTFDLSSDLRLKPSVLLKEDFDSPTNIDLNTFLVYNERFWFGGSYRTSAPLFTDVETDNLKKRNAFAILAQVYATPRFRVGYSYDISLGTMKSYNTHEISIGYTFFKSENGRILNPRNL